MMIMIFLSQCFSSQLVIDGIRDLHTAVFNSFHIEDLKTSLTIGNSTFDLTLIPLDMNPVIELQYNNYTRIHKNTFKVFDAWVLQNSLQVGIGRLTQTNDVIEGRIILNDATFVIYHVDNYKKMKKKDDVYPNALTGFVAYKEEDVIDLSGAHIGGCGSHKLPFNAKLTKSNLSRSPKADSSKLSNWSRLSKRDVPAGCPSDKKVVYVGAATDCTYATFLGNDQSVIIQQLISNFATASSIYERSFNVGLGLFKVNIKMECGDGTDSSTWNKLCSDNYDITERLSDFSKWRANSGGKDAGLWHLISTCPSGSTVGVAWLNQVCQTELVTQNVNGQQQQVSGAGVSSATSRDQFQVIAHEIGHNFGAVHDCTAQTCGNGNGQDCCPCEDKCDCGGRFIMNPTSTVQTKDFSACSVKNICTNLQTNGKCLLAPNSKPLIQGNVCGNGIKETGEQCDCGDQCDTDKCCTNKCTFKNNAVCSDKNQACCNNCQYAAKDTVCRKAINDQCDAVEKCAGDVGDCPADVHTPDGTGCNVNGTDAQCASGYCTSRDIQCKARSSTSISMSGACPDLKTSCTLTCFSGSYNACVQLSGNFIDGTQCGYKGLCSNGNCQYNNVFDQVVSYFTDQPYLGIALLLFIVMLVLGICCRLVPNVTNRIKRQQRQSSTRRQDSRYEQGYPLSTYPQ